jgi:hypothetical protein
MLNNEETLNLDQETIFLKESVYKTIIIYFTLEDDTKQISLSDNLIFSFLDKIQHSIACSYQNSSGQLSRSFKA